MLLCMNVWENVLDFIIENIDGNSILQWQQQHYAIQKDKLTHLINDIFLMIKFYS